MTTGSATSPRRRTSAPRPTTILSGLARGRYFKWASHDDLYTQNSCGCAWRRRATSRGRPRALLGRADRRARQCAARTPYLLDTANPAAAPPAKPAATPGGDDFYGVIRTDVLNASATRHLFQRGPDVRRRTVPDGPFHQVPRVLYFRREHPRQASRGPPSRQGDGPLGPARASRLVHPMCPSTRSTCSGTSRRSSRRP